MRVLIYFFSLVLFAAVASAETREVYSPSDGFLNLRTGPSTGQRVVQEMLNGERVNILDRSGSWAKVRAASGSLGWASERYLIAPGTHNSALLPRRECALQIASRKTLSEARTVLQNYRYDTTYARVYRASNGWYAVSVGTLQPHMVRSVMRDWKQSGRIPSDSLCSLGIGYVAEVNWRTSSPSIASALTSRNPSINCSRIDLEQEIAACYLLVVGPKACSQAVSEGRTPGDDTYADRVAISSMCTGAINATYAKELLPVDVIIAAIDEGVETMCESDNGLVALLGCTMNVTRWLQKISEAQQCERQLVQACG